MSTMAYITYTTCRYNRDRMQNKWFLIQLSKKKRNKIKIRVLPFSKSYPKIESTWPTAKCRGRKSFDTWYYKVVLYVSFSSKSKAINVFLKYILIFFYFIKIFKFFLHVYIYNMMMMTGYKHKRYLERDQVNM